MTLQDFITKYNGKHIDFDGKPPLNQCMDLYRQYVKEVWGLSQTPTVVGAAQVYDTIGSGFEKFTHGEIKPGDVMTWDETYTKNGHVAIVISTNPVTFTSFEQNNPQGSGCRIVTHNYGHIKGWFRPVSTLSKTFMGITVVANRSHMIDLPARLESAKQRIIEYSGNKFEPVFHIVNSDFGDVPFSQLGTGTEIDVPWYRTHVTPLTLLGDQATILLLNQDQWHSSNFDRGIMLWGDPGKPVRMGVEVVDPQFETDPTIFTHVVIHEICHALLFLTGQRDFYIAPDSSPHFVVHDLLYQAPPQYETLFNLVDYRALQSAEVKIHG